MLQALLKNVSSLAQVKLQCDTNPTSSVNKFKRPENKIYMSCC